MDLREERDLIARAKQDPAVFGRLYDEYYPKIFGYILRRTGDVDVAQDVTASTFFKALDKLWQFRWQGAPFSAWLYRIATNEVNQYFRKGQRSISLDVLEERGFKPVFAATPEDEVADAREEIERHRAYRAYQSAIGSLGIKYQEVLTLRFFERKKFSEIAEILGKSEGTVKSLAHRGIEQLRKMQLYADRRVVGNDAPVRAKGYQQ